LKLSGLTDHELDVFVRTIIKKIDLINLETLPQTTWEKAIKLTENVDEFDDSRFKQLRIKYRQHRFEIKMI
jgi:hypothetical protein